MNDYVSKSIENLLPFWGTRYENFAPPKREAKIEGRGGQNKKIYVLKIDTFKYFCMLSNTKKGKEIRRYYVKMEGVIQGLLVEQAKDVGNKLLEKNEEIKIKDQEIFKVKKQKEETFICNYGKKPILYIGLSESNIAKFGYTDDINRRLKEHKRDIGEHFTFEYVYESLYNREMERIMKKNDILNQYRINKIYNGKNQIELYQLSNEFTIEDLHSIIIKIKNETEINEAEKMRKELKQKEEEIDKHKEVIKIKDRKLNQLQKDTFIARHIITCEEIEFKNYADANKISHCGSHSLRDNYLNKPLQNRGYTYRTKGLAYWKPPENFKFDINQKSSTQMKICKSIHTETGEVSYYNSTIEAAKFIDLYNKDDDKTQMETKRRKLTWALKNGGHKSMEPSIYKYKWIRLKTCGSWVYPDSTVEDIEEVDEIEKEKEKNKESDEQKLMKIFQITNNKDDVLLVNTITKESRENGIKTCSRDINKILKKLGACRTKIIVNTQLKVAYTNIKLKY